MDSMQENVAELIQALFVIVGGVVVSVLGFVVVHRLVSVHTRHAHTDVAGFIYAVVGIMYAILLAYVTIGVWQQYDTASSDVDLEATDAYNIYHEADSLPESYRSDLQGIVKDYVQTTMDEEWPLLANGQASQRAEDLAHKIGAAVSGLPVNSTDELVRVDHITTQDEALTTERRLRLFEAGIGVHPMLWIMLVGGAIITIGFTYFFGIDNAWAHAAMIAALALVISGTLFMIQQVNHPFAGGVSVSNEALRQVLDTFNS
jgi:hypothetical protein